MNKARVQGVRDLERKLKKLPMKVRKREIQKIFRKEMTPLRDEARRQAYRDNISNQTTKSKEIKKGWNALTLFQSINLFTSGGRLNRDYISATVGGKSTSKTFKVGGTKAKGSPYYSPQNLGKWIGNRKGNRGGPPKNAKNFIKNTADSKLKKVIIKLDHRLNRETKKVIKRVF